VHPCLRFVSPGSKHLASSQKTGRSLESAIPWVSGSESGGDRHRNEELGLGPFVACWLSLGIAVADHRWSISNAQRARQHRIDAAGA